MPQDSQGKVVWNQMDDPAGDPEVGVAVHIVLVLNGVQVPGYVAAIPKEILGDTNIATDNNGRWETTLIPNSLITPLNTKYQIVEDASDAPPNTYTIVVPDIDGLHWARNIVG